MNIQSVFIKEERDEKIVKENEEEKRKELKRQRNRERQRAYYHRQKELKKNEIKIKKERKKKESPPKSNAERQRIFRQRRKRQKLCSNEENVVQCRAVENIENETLQENQLQMYEQRNEVMHSVFYTLLPEVILHRNTGIPGDVSDTNEEANESEQIVIKNQKACQANLSIKSMCIATTFICNRIVYTDRCEAEIQVEIAPTLQAESGCKKKSDNKSTITEDKYFVISTTKYEPIFRSEPVALPTIKIEPLTESDKESETKTIKNEPAIESDEFFDSRTIKTEPATESYELPGMSTVENGTETHSENIFDISSVKIEPMDEIS